MVVRQTLYSGSRLVDIVADMLRSALAWEEKHGCSADETDHRLLDASTPIPQRIHYPPHLDESKPESNPPMKE